MKNLDVVTAAQIGNFVFCGEAQRLQENGHPSTNQPLLDRGTVYHSGLAATERIAGGSIGLGKLLVIVAILGALAWLFFWH